MNNILLRHFFCSPFAIIALALLIFLIVPSMLAPHIAPQNPYDLKELSLSNNFLPPATVKGGKMPFLFGTDQQGRCILSSILYGIRTSFFIGIVITLLSFFVGSLIGLMAGYYEKFIGSVFMRIAEVMYAFPPILIALVLSGLFDAQGVWPIIFVIFLSRWVIYARVGFGKTLVEKNKDYVEGARAVGCRSFRIMVRHIYPNTLTPLMVVAVVDLAMVIVLESTLSFLGVGLPPSEPSLGMLVNDGMKYIYAEKWWMIVFPGGVLFIMIVAINMLGDWLRLEMNPKLK